MAALAKQIKLLNVLTEKGHGQWGTLMAARQGLSVLMDKLHRAYDKEQEAILAIKTLRLHIKALKFRILARAAIHKKERLRVNKLTAEYRTTVLVTTTVENTIDLLKERRIWKMEGGENHILCRLTSLPMECVNIVKDMVTCEVWLQYWETLYNLNGLLRRLNLDHLGEVFCLMQVHTYATRHPGFREAIDTREFIYSVPKTKANILKGIRCFLPGLRRRYPQEALMWVKTVCILFHRKTPKNN